MKTPQSEIDKLLYPMPEPPAEPGPGYPPAEHALTPERLSRQTKRPGRAFQPYATLARQPRTPYPLPAPSTPRLTWRAIQFLLAVFFVLLLVGIFVLGYVNSLLAGGPLDPLTWLLGWS